MLCATRPQLGSARSSLGEEGGHWCCRPLSSMHLPDTAYRTHLGLVVVQAYIGPEFQSQPAFKVETSHSLQQRCYFAHLPVSETLHPGVLEVIFWGLQVSFDDWMASISPTWCHIILEKKNSFLGMNSFRFIPSSNSLSWRDQDQVKSLNVELAQMAFLSKTGQEVRGHVKATVSLWLRYLAGTEGETCVHVPAPWPLWLSPLPRACFFTCNSSQIGQYCLPSDPELEWSR